MQEIGAFEAKTHLSSLLKDVERGERFVITRRGVPVAELSPVKKTDRDLDQIVKDILEMRQSRPKVTREEIAQWKHEGHKY